MPNNDPYESIIKKLNKSKINYILIGVAGINFYVNAPGDIFSTQDFDMLLKPNNKNLLEAFKILKSNGYSLNSNNEPIGKVDSWLVKRIIEQSSSITAIKDSMRIDIITNAGNINYQDWNKTKRNFYIGKSKIPVGGLSQLIRSKQNINREKDIIFLKLYKIKLKNLLRNSRKKREF